MLEKTSEEEYQKYYKKQLDTIFNLDSYYEKRKPNKPLGLADNTVLDSRGNKIKVVEIGDFKNGYAIVKAYIDNSGQIKDAVTNDKYVIDDILEIASIYHEPSYNYIDKNYTLIVSKRNSIPNRPEGYDWFREVSDFHYGFAVVKSYGKYYIDGEGNKFTNYTGETAFDFVGDYGMQLSFSDIVLLDRNGNSIKIQYSSNGSYDAKNAKIHKTPIGNVINLEKNSWSILGYYKNIDIYQNKSFIVVDKFGPTHADAKKEISHFVYYLNVDLKDYKCTKKLFNYELNNGKTKYNVNKEPIKIFDNRYTLCIKDDFVYLYDQSNKEYTRLGNVREVSYDNNVIVTCNKDEQIEKVRLIYNEKLLDITEYYKNNLMEVEDYEINNNVELLSKNDYFIKNENDLIKKAQEEKARKALEERKKIVAGDIEAIEKARANNSNLEEELLAYERETGDLVDEAVNRIAFIQNLKGSTMMVKAKSAVIEVGEGNDRHKEINPIFIAKGLYSSLDLSDEDMVNVKVSHLDLSGHNVRPFNPQKVYKKDMSFSNYSGIIFPVTTIFKDVDVRGSTFTTDGIERTMDINEDNFIGSIYDETTTLDGVPLTDLLDRKTNTSRK